MQIGLLEVAAETSIMIHMGLPLIATTENRPWLWKKVTVKAVLIVVTPTSILPNGPILPWTKRKISFNSTHLPAHVEHFQMRFLSF